MNALAPAGFRTQPQKLLFTVADLDLLVERGVIAENARIELIGGELIEMASEGEDHIDHKSVLTVWFARNLPDGFMLVPDATLRLSDRDAPEPDLYIFPSRLRTRDVQGPDLTLVVEIADTTQAYDLRRKADLYCRSAVAEYWVVDIRARRIHVHTSPTIGGYEHVVVRTYDDVLEPTGIPGMKVKLNALQRISQG